MKGLLFHLVLTLGLLSLTIAPTSAAIDQGSATAQINGVVQDVQQRPVADAQVRISGPVSKATATSPTGAFAFADLPAGIYRLDVTKSGFDPAFQDNIVVIAGTVTTLNFALAPVSLTTLKVIGSVSAVTTRARSINVTPAAIADLSATAFSDQGVLAMNQVLNQIPGIIIGVTDTTVGSPKQNAASPLSPGIASIRGGLPYETESLIDGHAVSLGQFGYFSPSFLSPYLLQDVEVVKGPGATSPSINYAVNGTVNYRTLEPTRKPKFSTDLGLDQYGGNLTNFRTTGTLPGGRLSYAFDYVTQGTQGPNRGYVPPVDIFFPTGPTFLNGQPINMFKGYKFPAGPSNILGSFNVKNDFVMCCLGYPMNFNQRNELAKLRYTFGPATTLTLTWLGSQAGGDDVGGDRGPYNDFFFAPPASYTGSIPAGGPMVASSIGMLAGWLNITDTSFFESAFTSPLGQNTTLLLRQYDSAIQTFVGGPGSAGPDAGGLTSVTGGLYGSIYFGSSSTPTVFNGQVGTITANQYQENRTYNKLNGYTAEILQQAGRALLTLSYDYQKTSTLSTMLRSPPLKSTILVPGGSNQTFQSVMLRGQFELGPRWNATFSDNFGSYKDLYSQDGGATFRSATHTYQAPRLSATYRASADQSFRASLGTSIAPPYINLLNNNQVVSPNAAVPTFYTTTANSGDVLPETTFGYNLGFDARIARYTILSFDAYQTLLHNQFLTTTSQQGTFTGPPNTFYAGVTAPLYVTKTANLGHSQYEGLELSVQQSPPVGWGYKFQGALLRAFTYDLPAGFYDTAKGPNTTNLGILPNINFQSSNFSYNGLSTARVPYSMGYAEVNHRTASGAAFLAGVTYYGPNNSYNEPAFGIVNASYSQPISRNVSLQASVYNLTNAYPQMFPYGAYGAPATPILTPLVNGKLGPALANVVGPATARLTLHLEI